MDLNFCDVPENPEDKFKPMSVYLILFKFSDIVKEYFKGWYCKLVLKRTKKLLFKM